MFLSLVCLSILGVDFGSQFSKMAESTISGEPRVIKDASNSAAIPSAAATKLSIDVDQIPESLENFPVLFAKKALRVLKYHPDHGYEFLPMTVGRSNTQFHTSKNITSAEFIALYFKDYLLNHGDSYGLTFALPAYWTTPQRDALFSALQKSRIPVEAFIDDAESLAAHYGAIRYTRYQKATRNVLFVDMGATSFKAYGVTFEWNKKGQYTMANQTAIEWSEDVGGYYCAKVVAAKENVSVRKAAKLLKLNSNRYSHLFKNQTAIMETLLKRAKSKIEHQAKFGKFEKNSLKIDEVQLIGGASKMPFVKQLIINATNCTNVLRDFNINEEISVGAVYAVQNHRGLSRTPPVFFGRMIPLTISVKCNGVRTLCTKGGKCNENVSFNHRGCDLLEVISNDGDVPKGASTVLSSYKLLNITDMNFTESDADENLTGIVTIDKNEISRIEGVTWCREKECYPISIKEEKHVNEEMKNGDKFIKAYEVADQEKRKRDKYIPEIEELISYINLDKFYEIDPNVRWELEPIKAAYEMGTLRTLKSSELKEYAKILRTLIKNSIPESKLTKNANDKEDEL